MGCGTPARVDQKIWVRGGETSKFPTADLRLSADRSTQAGKDPYPGLLDGGHSLADVDRSGADRRARSVPERTG
jgi:hypothetical protein